MTFSFSVGKNFVAEIDLFYRIRSYSDGITFFECIANLDTYLGNHHPRFYVKLTIFSITLIHFEIYDVRHLEDRDFIDTTALGHEIHRIGPDVRLLLMQPYGKKKEEQPRAEVMKRGMPSDERFHVILDRDPGKIQVCDGDPSGIVTPDELERLLAYLKKYRIPFLNFWNRPSMDYFELMQQVELVDLARIDERPRVCLS